MEPVDLDNLRSICDAATPGPWLDEHDDGDIESFTISATNSASIVVVVEAEEGEFDDDIRDVLANDFAFIAAARAAVPMLLDRVKELEGEVGELVAECARLRGMLVER
jgi:hypothetical protein